MCEFAARFDSHGGELSTASRYDGCEGLNIRDANSWPRAVADMTSRLMCSLPIGGQNAAGVQLKNQADPGLAAVEYFAGHKCQCCEDDECSSCEGDDCSMTERGMGLMAHVRGVSSVGMRAARNSL